MWINLLMTKSIVLSTSWKVTKDINRMGIKLTGNKINSIAGRDMLSDGNQIGSIQITLSGEPIVLLIGHY